MRVLEGVNILRTGEFIDANNHNTKVTKQDLRELANNYKPEVAEAPIVLGHSMDDVDNQSDSAPSFGWVKRVYTSDDGNQLYADLELTEPMENLIDSGHYKKRSLAYYSRASKTSPIPGQLYIRHLAMLGAKPPAVKGLEDVKFCEPDDFIMNKREFAEGDAASTEALLNENSGSWLRFILTDGEKGYPGEITEFIPEPAKDNNWLYNVAKKQIAGQFVGDGEETYDFTITKQGDGWMKSYKPVIQSDEEADSIYGGGLELAEVAPSVVPNATPVVPAMDTAMMAKMEARLAQLELDNRKLMDELSMKRQDELSMMADKFYSEGKITEGIVAKPELLSLLNYLDKQPDQVRLSESIKANPLDIVVGLLDKMPNLVTFGEYASTVAREEQVTFNPPPFTVMDESASELHSKVIKYCSSNELDPNNPKEYRLALKKVSV